MLHPSPLRTLALLALLLMPVRTSVAAGPSQGSAVEPCTNQKVCAAHEKTALAKVKGRCGMGLDCKCEKLGSECGKKLTGGNKYWYRCDCHEKKPCHKEVCALYESTAKTKAAASCKRPDCECTKTSSVCDTNWRGKNKTTFKCVCK